MTLANSSKNYHAIETTPEAVWIVGNGGRPHGSCLIPTMGPLAHIEHIPTEVTQNLSDLLILEDGAVLAVGEGGTILPLRRRHLDRPRERR